MSTERCNEDFVDGPTGVVFRAGTYSREFRDFCRRTENMPIEERQRLFRSRHKQGSRSTAPETRHDDGGFTDYVRLLNGGEIEVANEGEADGESEETGYHFGPSFDC